MSPGRRRDRFGELSDPTLHVSPDAARTVHLAHHVVKQHVRRAGRRRRRRRADDGVGREGRLERVGFEPAIEDRTGRARQDLRRARCVRSEAQEAPAHPGEAPEVTWPGGERRWSLEQRRLDRASNAVQHGFVLGQPLGVPRGELRHLAPVHGGVPAEEQRATVRERRERRGVAAKDAIPVPREVEVAHDLRPEQAHDVRGRRDPKPFPGLLRDARAAHPVLRLEHHHREPRACEVRGRDQPVVAGADDGDVEGAHRVGVGPRAPRRNTPRVTSACGRKPGREAGL